MEERSLKESGNLNTTGRQKGVAIKMAKELPVPLILVPKDEVGLETGIRSSLYHHFGEREWLHGQRPEPFSSDVTRLRESLIHC